MLFVSILFDSKNSNVPWFVLEMQERGELVCYFASPQVGLWK